MFTKENTTILFNEEELANEVLVMEYKPVTRPRLSNRFSKFFKKHKNYILYRNSKNSKFKNSQNEYIVIQFIIIP
jgi:hypothetical protein